MGRNKNKYLKDKSNQPGFCYTKCSNSNVKNSLDNIMDEFGFQKDIVYSENKDKRWALKEELVTKVAGSENADSEAIIYELDSFKPSDAKCIAKSTKKPKDELMVKKTNKNRDCQKCQEKANKEVKDEKRKKSTSMIVFNKEVYKKKGVNCGCCNELDAKQRKKFKNEKIKALSECAYDPYDEEEDFDNAEEQEIKSFLTAEKTLRPMSIDIESILNDSNENLRFKPRDPDNGFEVINSKLLLEEENSSSDFEYIADDELKP